MTDGLSESAVDMSGKTIEEFARDKLSREVTTSIGIDGPQLQIELAVGHSVLLRLPLAKRVLLENGLAMVEAALNGPAPRPTAFLGDAVRLYMEHHEHD